AITSTFVDFGDGQSATLAGNAATVQHVYNASGTYQVTATATDSSGASGSGSTIVVVGTAGPTASFTASPQSGTVLVTSFHFDASASTGSGLTYAWNFGDSNTATGVTADHTYATTGTKTITLTVTDNQGRTATTTRQVTVNP